MRDAVEPSRQGTTAMTRRSWQVISNTTKTGGMAVGTLLVGLVFLWLTRHAQAGDSNQAAAMWLGVLLAALGLAGLVFQETVVVTVEPGPRRLVIERRTRWSRQRTVLPFHWVEAVQVVKIGSRADGAPSFWLQILPRQGKPTWTGRWSLDEREMAQQACELADAVGCACAPGPGARPAAISTLHLLGAALGAVGGYAIWFRLTVGPWCGAMWFGTAPPVIMLVAFVVLLALLRRFWR